MREPAAVVDGLAQGVRLDAVKEHVRHAGAIELSERAVKVSVRLDGLAARGDDERAPTGQQRIAELGKLSCPEEHAGLSEERI